MKKPKKFLWIYPANKLMELENTWTYYGTRANYRKWLKNMPVDKVKRIFKGSAKFERIK